MSLTSVANALLFALVIRVCLPVCFTLPTKADHAPSLSRRHTSYTLTPDRDPLLGIQGDVGC